MKTKVRIYFPDFPYPVNAGSPFVVDGLVRRYLKEGCDVELVYWKVPTVRGAFPQELLIKELFPVQLSEESSTKRCLRVLSSCFGTYSSQEEVFYPRKYIKAWGSLSPVDLAIYNYGFSWRWLTHLSTSGPSEEQRIVFHHNIESNLVKQRVGGIFSPIHLINSHKLARHEVSLAKLVDKNWFVSEPDLRSWIELGGDPSRAAVHFPDVFDEDFSRIRSLRQTNPRNVTQPILGFLGRLDFGPNAEGLSWILKTLSPLLRKRSFSGQIRVVGSNASVSQQREMSQYSFISFEGFHPSLDKFWTEIDWLLAPHLRGSGVRVKLIESLMFQIPTLTHQEAAIRLSPELQKSPFLRIEEDPSAWIDHIMHRI